MAGAALERRSLRILPETGKHGRKTWVQAVVLEPERLLEVADALVGASGSWQPQRIEGDGRGIVFTQAARQLSREWTRRFNVEQPDDAAGEQGMLRRWSNGNRGAGDSGAPGQFHHERVVGDHDLMGGMPVRSIVRGEADVDGQHVAEAELPRPFHVGVRSMVMIGRLERTDCRGISLHDTNTFP